MRKLLLVSTLTVLAFVAIAVGAVRSAGASDGDAGNQLAGTWRVTVNRPAPLSVITSLQVYTGDGSVIETANDIGSRSASYGAWERVEGRTYASSGLFFRFDPQTGAQVATHKIDRTIQLSADGQTFAAVARAVTYDMNGNVIAELPRPLDGRTDAGRTHPGSAVALVRRNTSTEGDEMFAKTRGTTKAALLALVAAVLLAGTAVSDADAQGLTWQQLQAQAGRASRRRSVLPRPRASTRESGARSPATRILHRRTTACCSVRRAICSSGSTSSAPTSTTASGAEPSPTSSAR